jgi:hypothetical protein
MNSKNDGEIYEMAIDLFILTDVSQEVLEFMEHYETECLSAHDPNFTHMEEAGEPPIEIPLVECHRKAPNPCTAPDANRAPHDRRR